MTPTMAVVAPTWASSRVPPQVRPAATVGIAPVMADGVAVARVHVPAAERLVVPAALPAASRVAALRPEVAALGLPRAPVTPSSTAVEAVAAPSLPGARETTLRAVA